MAEEQQGTPKKRKMFYRIKWIVNPHRKDQRTGAINPVPRDRYTQMLFDEIEKVFRGDRNEKHERAAEGMEEDPSAGRSGKEETTH